MHLDGHRPSDLTTDVLQHERKIQFTEQPRLADGSANLGMTHHVPVSRTANHFECRAERRMVIEDRNANPVPQLPVGFDVLFQLGILESTTDRVASHPDQQVGSVIVGAAHRDIELDLESRWSHLLHGLELVEYVFERREMVLQPRVASPRIPPDSLGHVARIGRDGPRTDLDPATLPLAKQTVHRHAGGLAHQVIHRRPQPQRCHVANMIERIGADVALADRVGFQCSTLAQPHQPVVRLHLVDKSFRRPVEVLQFVVNPLVVPRMNLVNLDRLDTDRTVRQRLGTPPGGQSMSVGRQHSPCSSSRSAHRRQEPTTVRRPRCTAVKLIEKPSQE